MAARIMLTVFRETFFAEGWGAMMQAFLHLTAIMPLAAMVMMGLVLGITQPITPMGLAMTRTPGSSRRFWM